MNYLVVITVTTITLLIGESSGSDLVTGCSSHCTLDFDKDLSCWNKTLNFHNQILVSQMRYYTTIQTQRAIWSVKHGRNFEYKTEEDATTSRMRSIAPGNAEDEDGIIEPMDYEKIVGVLMDKVQQTAEFYFTHEDAPMTFEPIECPLACEHNWDPFFWMFLVSGGCNFILAGISMTLVWCLDRRDTIQAKLELAECEIVKFDHKLNDSGIGALKRKSVHSLH